MTAPNLPTEIEVLMRIAGLSEGIETLIPTKLAGILGGGACRALLDATA